MGKAGRWIRSFLITRRERKGKDKADSQLLPSTGHVSSAVPTPSAKEKRRWSFRRSAATSKETSASLHGQLASTSSHCFSEVHVVVYEQLAAAATSDVAVATAEAAPPAPERSVSGSEEAAAIKIQSAFRSYLARKALCALRGMVKLQAMVRGQLVRRQANMTLRRMQALVAAQKRARAERLRLLEEDKHTRWPRPPTSRRSSPQHHRSRKPLVVDRGSEENVKIVEVDNGGGDARGTPRAGGWRSTCASASLSRTPAKAELYQKVSPTPSALTDGSARTISGRFEDYPFSAASEAGGCHRAAAAGNGNGKVCHASDHATLQLFPNYMANTESSRAKARSQSAPRQRHEMSASPSPSPSCGAGGGRRRASLDPRDLAGARMERCASQARASASGACPWAVSLDRSSASLPGSECGSSSTVVTAATAARVTTRHGAPVAAATV